jgi:4'-phosphopantetheinyl transferase
MMKRLEPGHVDLWLTFYRDIQDRKLLDAYAALLTDEECSQQKRFYFAEDRHRYLVTRALVRTVLSRYTSVSPQRWRFTKNPYGRPLIVNEDGRTNSISFNISHTAGLIICGITSGQELGVDTEAVKLERAYTGLASHFFSPPEVSALHALPREMQTERFFHYWTLKESYIKARGMGLSIPLDKFGFHFPDESSIRLSIDRSLEDLPERWRFWLCRPSAEHLVAVCVERARGISQHLMLRSIVPLDSDEPFECPILRRSPD